MEKVVISVDTTNNLSETAQKRTVTSDPLPEQEVFRGPMETWSIKKSQVLTKAREKVKRCREKLQAPVKHLELIEKVMPTKGKQIKKGPLRTSNPTSIQPDLEDVFRRSLHKGWSRRRSCAHSSRRRKDHDLTQIVIRGHQQRFWIRSLDIGPRSSQEDASEVYIYLWGFWTWYIKLDNSTNANFQGWIPRGNMCGTSSW